MGIVISHEIRIPSLNNQDDSWNVKAGSTVHVLTFKQVTTLEVLTPGPVFFFRQEKRVTLHEVLDKNLGHQKRGLPSLKLT